jgi:predicted enzyme related to lactoylglutathione lyase
MSKHPIVHIEFSANDLASATKFYSELFGWKIEHTPELNYSTFETGEGEVGGGLNPVSDQSPAGTTTVHVGTDDIEASLRKVESLGGKTVVPKTEIPGFGWFALFSDPTGNIVGLYTGNSQQA